MRTGPLWFEIVRVLAATAKRRVGELLFQLFVKQLLGMRRTWRCVFGYRIRKPATFERQIPGGGCRSGKLKLVLGHNFFAYRNPRRSLYQILTDRG
jgi:hypothetical protein